MLCPICSGKLENRKVAPCYDCGHDPKELKEFADGVHNYDVYEIFGNRLVLCNFCSADFDSYDHDFLGFPEELANNYPLEYISKCDDPRLGEDRYCPECQCRLAYLVVLKDIRDKNAT